MKPKCFPCHGNGYVTVWAGPCSEDETHFEDCPDCNGTGERTEQDDDEQGENAA